MSRVQIPSSSMVTTFNTKDTLSLFDSKRRVQYILKGPQLGLSVGFLIDLVFHELPPLFFGCALQIKFFHSSLALVFRQLFRNVVSLLVRRTLLRLCNFLFMCQGKSAETHYKASSHSSHLLKRCQNTPFIRGYLVRAIEKK